MGRRASTPAFYWMSYAAWWPRLSWWFWSGPRTRDDGAQLGGSGSWCKSHGGKKLGCAPSVLKLAALFIRPWCYTLPCLKNKMMESRECHYNKRIILCLGVLRSFIQELLEKHPWFSIKIQFVDLCISRRDFRDHFKKSNVLFFETWLFEKPDPFGYILVFKFGGGFLKKKRNSLR